MPTKKRGKGARPATRRSKARPARGARKTPRNAGAARKNAAPRAAAGRKRGRTSTMRPKRPPARPARAGAVTSRELTALKARFQREKSALEKRLTDTVREIGQLRHHETRAAQLERQLKERDDTIAQLRTQLGALRNRELAPVDDEEVQPSLALGSRPADDIDDFDEDVGAEDDDELI